MAEILYSPGRERVLATNAWAFLHWLRTTRGVDLLDWPALQRWSAASPAGFATAIAAFAQLPDQPILLARRDGGSVPHHPALNRPWPPSLLNRPLADVLLHADLRPDDRLLVVGPAWPWLSALLEGCAVTLSASNDVLSATAEARAMVLVAPATILGEAAFQRRGSRPNLANLRAIVATGGPLSPEARRRVYTWIKSDVILLARTGDTYWGNPLEPVLARPPATPAFVTPRA
jgi:hypothetical protein